MINYQTELFYQNLVNLINNCNLPIGTAKFVLKDCLNLLENGYQQAVLEEQNNQNKQEEVVIAENNFEKLDKENK